MVVMSLSHTGSVMQVIFFQELLASHPELSFNKLQLLLHAQACPGILQRCLNCTSCHV